MEGIERDQTLLPCPFCGAAAEHGSPDRYTDGPRKRMMKARDGIEAQHGLNDVYPGDDYPAPPSQVSPDAERGPQDALDILVQDLWDNGKNLDWDEWRQRIAAYSGQRQVSPDAEAILEAAFAEAERLGFYHIANDIPCINIAIGRLRTVLRGALTAATMREREAIEQLIEEAIQSVTSPTATAARTMARTILSMVRARKCSGVARQSSPPDIGSTPDG